MIKKYKWLIAFIAVIIALIVVAIVFSEDEGKYIKDISLNEVVDKIDNKDSFILYIKQTDCEHCKAFTPKFISVLNDNNIEAYSLNLTNLSDNDKEAYNDFVNELKEAGYNVSSEDFDFEDLYQMIIKIEKQAE